MVLVVDVDSNSSNNVMIPNDTIQLTQLTVSTTVHGSNGFFSLCTLYCMH